jgi:hypothetical protein
MKFFQALVTGVIGAQVVLAATVETPELVERSLASDILQDIENAATCAACEVCNRQLHLYFPNHSTNCASGSFDRPQRPFPPG